MHAVQQATFVLIMYYNKRENKFKIKYTYGVSGWYIHTNEYNSRKKFLVYLRIQ